ncbi:MAG: 4a-hydroxytetrahydrobiopterin dehydratase [Sinobacteraceae bacterium]|nr:4a-hydroxytetrahydrobiopterin dehydratase [Nevskiaceae bacterium]MBV9911633.1 4a-hydroxytetrahydrobiopterin dehydratase [Nevskiaceae bacterium]
MAATTDSSVLAARKCKPCEGGAAPLERTAAQQLLGQLQGWELAADARSISRRFTFRDFYRTMSFVNAIAHLANIEDHHPDLEVGYNYCRVRYTTHAVKGLSENDFICAARIDLIPTA